MTGVRGRLTAALAGVFCTAAMLVPTVSTTFGLGLSHSGSKGGLKPVAQGLALPRTGEGQVGRGQRAVRRRSRATPRS